jgi:hypothetical protein
MQSELAWTLEDYKEYDVEPPERIIQNPKLTEGDLMTEPEIEEYIADCLGVLAVLKDGSPERRAQILASFLTDLAYLRKINRIEDELYGELMTELGVEI